MSYFELPEPRRERCPFCDNVAGRETEGGVRCAVVLETDLTLTFVAPRRQHPGRLLVISKRHAPTLFDLTDEEAAAIMRDARRAALAVTRAFKPDGLTIYQNNGVGAIPEKGPVMAYERALRNQAWLLGRPLTLPSPPGEGLRADASGRSEGALQRSPGRQTFA
jgi:diadenosine tetraphosphate (Ap4A) HIT family hydrolase